MDELVSEYKDNGTNAIKEFIDWKKNTGYKPTSPLELPTYDDTGFALHWGSRKVESVSNVSGYQSLVEYMKDLSTQEILDTKFPDASADQLYDAIPDAVSESDWDNIYIW